MKKILLILICTPIICLGQQWSQLGLNINGDAPNDVSGASVSISSNGTIVAIGAPGNIENNEISAGYTRVLEFDGTDWVQIGQDIDGETDQDISGARISLNGDGNILAIGAPGNPSNGVFSGRTRVFEFNGNVWTQMGQSIDGEAAEDGSGSSISLSEAGNILAIGAVGNDANGAFSGRTRIFEFDGTSWVQMGQSIDGDAAEDVLGSSLSVSENGGGIIAIGSAGNDSNGDLSGLTRVFEFNGTLWTQVGEDIVGESANDGSGASVSLSTNGDIVAIGAPGNMENGEFSGHARVFEFDGSAWIQLGEDIDGDEANMGFGNSVSLNADGRILAVGAAGNGENEDLPGFTRIFEYDGNTWVQIGLDIEGEQAEDGSGFSVSISADGTIVAIGAIGNDTNGEVSGHTRVFEFANITCEPPSDFTILNITSTTADFSWSAVAEAAGGYTYSVFEENADPNTATPVFTNTTTALTGTATGLAEDTSYDAYVVSICDNNNISDVSLVINFTTSVLSVEDATLLTVIFYPNPTTGQLFFNAEDTITKIEMYNLLGQKVLSEVTQNTTVDLNISAQPDGVYFASIFTDRGTQQIRIIKD